jgi:hypothetical protein
VPEIAARVLPSISRNRVHFQKKVDKVFHGEP